MPKAAHIVASDKKAIGHPNTLSSIDYRKFDVSTDVKFGSEVQQRWQPRAIECNFRNRLYRAGLSPLYRHYLHAVQLASQSFVFFPILKISLDPLYVPFRISNIWRIGPDVGWKACMQPWRLFLIYEKSPGTERSCRQSLREQLCRSLSLPDFVPLLLSARHFPSGRGFGVGKTETLIVAFWTKCSK